MFNNLKMSKLLYLFSIILIFVLSCDGRERVHKTNEEVLIENKLLDSFSENVKYFPTEYTEQTIDTIFSNGITSKMTFYSDMKNAVYAEEIIDSITHKTFYREFVVDVKIDSINNSIFNEKIDKSYLVKQKAFSQEEAKLYILNDFSISSLNDVNNELPMLALHYIHIESKQLKTIRFFFLEGKSYFEIIT